MKSTLYNKKGRAIQLFLSQCYLELKLFFREPSAIIWTFIFPLVLISVIGWFWGSSETILNLSIADADQSTISRNIIQQLSNQAEIDVNEISPNFTPGSSDKVNKSIILRIPKGIQESVRQGNSVSMQLYYQPSDNESASQRLAQLYAVLPKIQQQLYPKTATIHLEHILSGTPTLSYMHFVYPGILALSILSTGIFGISLRLSSYRERGQLKRLALTPLKKWEFILPHVCSRYIVTLLQIIFLMIFAYMAFGISMKGNIISLWVVVSLGLFTFISMGFLIACRIKQVETANAVANFIFVPMLFLGGIYFPIDNSSPLLKTIAKSLPLLPFSNALRDIINHGEPLFSLLPGLWPLFITTGICFFLSLRLFRWH